MSRKPELDLLVNIYCSLAKKPNIVNGRILKSESKSTIKIQSKFSQRNLERKEIVKFKKLYVLNTVNLDSITFQPTDVSSELMSSYSKSEKYYCVLRECFVSKEINSGANKKKQFLEIWDDGLMYKNFDVDEFDIHGSIYSDGEFGSLEWSPDERKIVYIAEKKAVKCQPFYKQKPTDAQEKAEETILLGEEYSYKPTWGEQLVDKHQPVIGICDLESETLKVLQGIPNNLSPGQVIWSKNGNGVYGIVLNNEPRRLGLIYCTNRKGYVFHLTLNGDFEILSEENKSVRSPRLSLEGNYLFWLQRPSNGPHDGCQELVKYDIASKKIEVIIPIVRKPSNFCGIYSHGLPKRCFSNDGKKLFFSTVNKTKVVSYSVNIDTKDIIPIKTDKSSIVLDVHNDMILISTSCLQSTPSLKVSKSVYEIEWISVTSSDVILNSIVQPMEFKAKESSSDFEYFNAIYFGPEPPSNKKIPLIVYPHGGPHSCVTNSFFLESAFFVSIGFGVLHVNYRGSTGAGQDGIEFLPGRIGDSDVKDNHEAVNSLLKEIPYIDANKIVLFGGSHGGFLVTHLSAQYPEFYKAVVARNPVIDVQAMYCTTDIPDWDTIESGFPFNEALPLTVEQCNRMYNVSPIRLANRIKAPTFLMLGKKDLRVPFSQGLYLYHTLNARNVKTRINVYDDNHPLGLVPVHMDSVINAALWFLENLEIKY